MNDYFRFNVKEIEASRVRVFLKYIVPSAVKNDTLKNIKIENLCIVPPLLNIAVLYIRGHAP